MTSRTPRSNRTAGGQYRTRRTTVVPDPHGNRAQRRAARKLGIVSREVVVADEVDADEEVPDA